MDAIAFFSEFVLLLCFHFVSGEFLFSFKAIVSFSKYVLFSLPFLSTSQAPVRNCYCYYREYCFVIWLFWDSLCSSCDFLSLRHCMLNIIIAENGVPQKEHKNRMKHIAQLLSHKDFWNNLNGCIVHFYYGYKPNMDGIH